MEIERGFSSEIEVLHYTDDIELETENVASVQCAFNFIHKMACITVTADTCNAIFVVLQ